MIEKMRMASIDGVESNIEKIEQLFPNCITEKLDDRGELKKAINFSMLKQMLSKEIVDDREVYEFTWVGKNNAIVEANKSIKKTLRPSKYDSDNWNETENLYIEGDNEEALKLLQESYLGKIKMIYIDPPYNTGEDFIYNDDFKQSVHEFEMNSGYRDEELNRMIKNTDTSGRFHSNWCSMIYRRLLLSRNLLTDDGVIYISISDHEHGNLKKICDSIFGENSFVTTIHVELSATQGMKVKAAQNGNIVKNAEYILVYSKSGKKNIAENLLYEYRPDYDTHYSNILSDDGKTFTSLKSDFLTKYPNEKFTDLSKMYLQSDVFKQYVHNNIDKIFCFDKITGFDKKKFEEGVIYRDYFSNERLYTLYNNGTNLKQMLFLSKSFGQCNDFNKSYGLRKIRGDWWKDYYKDMGNVSKEGDIKFENGKKPLRLIKDLIYMTTKSHNNDIILDFFSGSATTAHAVMQQNTEDLGNRKYIMIQVPEECENKNKDFENICEIGKERIRRSAKKIAEENPNADFDCGFRVFKVDTTNMKDVYYSVNDFNQGMLESIESNIKDDRTDLDLLFACVLEWGLPLSFPYLSEEFDGFTVHTYNEGDLIACFDEKISEDVIRIIAQRQPLRVVFRDSSFADSPSKINVTEIFKSVSPMTRIKVI